MSRRAAAPKEAPAAARRTGVSRVCGPSAPKGVRAAVRRTEAAA
jgi:hypothetical protein